MADKGRKPLRLDRFLVEMGKRKPKRDPGDGSERPDSGKRGSGEKSRIAR